MPTLFKVLGHPGRFAPAASGNLTELWRLNLNRVLDSVAGHIRLPVIIQALILVTRLNACFEISVPV